MTKLKCIGGPSNGKIVEVSDSYMDVRVYDPYKATVSPIGPLTEETLTANYTIYTRRFLRSYDKNNNLEEVQYLAPYGVSDIESLRGLLT